MSLPDSQIAATKSNREFAYLFSIVFCVVAAYPLMTGGEGRVWAAIASLLFLVVALLRPSAVSRPNLVWRSAGDVIGRFVSPVVLAIVYFFAVIPTGLFVRGSRWLGARGADSVAAEEEISFWIVRKTSVGSFDNQF